MSAGTERRRMDKVRLGSRDPDLAGLRVLVVGAGRSGLAAVRLAVERRARVTLCDRAPAERIAEAVRVARTLGVEVRAGGHPPQLADDAERRRCPEYGGNQRSGNGTGSILTLGHPVRLGGLVAGAPAQPKHHGKVGGNNHPIQHDD